MDSAKLNGESEMEPAQDNAGRKKRLVITGTLLALGLPLATLPSKRGVADGLSPVRGAVLLRIL